MANVITPEDLGFIGGFGPALAPSHVGTNNSLGDDNKEEVVETTNENKVVDKKNEKAQTPPQGKQSLADILRADREARESKNKEHIETRTTKEELNKVKTELETLRNAPTFEKDPIGYCRRNKLSREEQVALGETLIYDIVPDKAPPDLRQRLYENKRTREDEARIEAEKEQRTNEQLEQARRNIEEFTLSLEQAARSLQAGTYPESEDWFVNNDGQLDHAAYVKSLMATANNLGNAANAQHTRADLSFANIAKVLETEIERRQKLRDDRRNKRTTNKTVEHRSNERNTERVETTSSRGLNTGTVEKPSWDDAERVRRAVSAGWGS